MSGFFDGFECVTRKVGGSGPPLLLLHGNPQTHVMWHRVAPRLARRHTVIAPDLRGYGFSWKPPATADHAPYAKRAMADELVALMSDLGHERFMVMGHDRGARVSHRMALDHPGCIERLAVLDIVPTLAHFERADMAFGLGYYHWFWLAQPHPFPETLISADPAYWFRHHTNRAPNGEDVFDPRARADYLAAVANPETVRGICEDYRAATTIDLEHDRQSRADGVRIACPLLVLWGRKGKIGKWYDALAIWRDYATGPVAGHAVDGGHYLAEEAPEAVVTAVEAFIDG